MGNNPSLVGLKGTIEAAKKKCGRQKQEGQGTTEAAKKNRERKLRLKLGENRERKRLNNCVVFGFPA